MSTITKMFSLVLDFNVSLSVKETAEKDIVAVTISSGVQTSKILVSKTKLSEFINDLRLLNLIN